MRESLFQLPAKGNISLQAQIREVLVSAILGGQLPIQDRIPSSRKMARRLGVSRNTVVLAYQGLIDDGYIVARERSGYYVNEAILNGRAERPAFDPPDEFEPPDWLSRYRVQPTNQENIRKPENWPDYPYPFIYGQVDHKLFPIAEWRECNRQALGKQWIDAWTRDSRDRDDPMLVEQIRTRVLPRRGIMVSDEEILITLGAQNALYMLASLLVTQDTVVAIEEPGYPDVRNIFRLRTSQVRSIEVDQEGLVVDARLAQSDVVFTTPSHHFPTTVTMPRARRQALLDAAREHDLVIIEDDYEFETNYIGPPCPALKSMDADGRVIYVGSLSKTLFPGLRMGFLVAPKALVSELRALRRLMMRHVPNNNQRAVALFLSLGYHDALIGRLERAYRVRWEAMRDALAAHLPDSSQIPTFGGSSYWVKGPLGLDSDALATEALESGVIIEPGRIYFNENISLSRHFRLGFSSIDSTMIEPGIHRLAQVIEAHMARKGAAADQ